MALLTYHNINYEFCGQYPFSQFAQFSQFSQFSCMKGSILQERPWVTVVNKPSSLYTRGLY
jgi:hypothetical protein